MVSRNTTKNEGNRQGVTLGHDQITPGIGGPGFELLRKGAPRVPARICGTVFPYFLHACKTCMKCTRPKIAKTPADSKYHKMVGGNG